MASAKGPTRDTCARVDRRDMERCFRCGVPLSVTAGSRHHRQLRRHGDHSPANLILLCGSGTTGCHGWVHSEPRLARAVGLIVRGTANPADTPAWSDWLRAWLLLDRWGLVTKVPPGQAIKMLEDSGHRAA